MKQELREFYLLNALLILCCDDDHWHWRWPRSSGKGGMQDCK